MTVSVVIPTWNGLALLQRALRGLEEGSTRASAVIVVDNGSIDGTADWVARERPSCIVIRNSQNRGFAAAVNQGIGATNSRWIALLNNDAIPSPSWLQALLTAGESGPRIGAVASRMMFESRPDVVSSAGVRVDRSGGAWDHLAGLAEWPESPVEIFGASAGACLYRRDMLDDVGPFEESFFAYLEDVALAWRARLRGWRAILAPAAVVRHAVSATAGEGSPLKRYYLARNKWMMLIRTYPHTVFLRDLPLIILRDVYTSIRSLAACDLVPLRGRVAAFRRLSRLIRERQRIQSHATAKWKDLNRVMSPLDNPWELRRRRQSVHKLASKSLV
jgi:GT2 family glycosyltransferase